MNDDTTWTAYGLIGSLATVYAVMLNTERGKAFAQEYTWASVVLGTALVLLGVRPAVDREQWNKVAGAFLVAAVPVVGRSLANKYLR